MLKNIVTNPGFETGSISQWTTANGYVGSFACFTDLTDPLARPWVLKTDRVASATYSLALTQAPISTPGRLYQSVTSVPNRCYKVPAWISCQTTSTASYCAVTFGYGNENLEIPNIPRGTPYTQYTFFTRAVAAEDQIRISATM